MHRNVLFCCDRKITKHNVISILFIDFFFFYLYHLLYSFLQSHVHLGVGVGVGVGDNLVKRHIGACVFASSLVHENIL